MAKPFHPAPQAGQYVVVDPSGRIVRIQDIITSWAATTYRVEHGGSWTRVA
ncbi:MAG: hypothetical protein J3T61_00310 [Candidatus Brocadiales bacterium]|nr:hypothetical protein [Candidatus Bathyanammoxibius sp.]